MTTPDKKREQSDVFERAGSPARKTPVKTQGHPQAVRGHPAAEAQEGSGGQGARSEIRTQGVAQGEEDS